MSIDGIARRLSLVQGRLRGAPGTRIRRGVRLTIERGGVVDVAGELDLGFRWRRGRPYPSQLVVRRGGTVRVQGLFAVGTDFRIWVADGAVLTLGSGGANYGLEIHCDARVTIGHDCLIGNNTVIRDSSDHAIIGSLPASGVTIGDHVWIGAGVTILPGVTIGDGAVVATGAVVTKNVPPRSLAAGVPAKVIREGIDWKK